MTIAPNTMTVGTIYAFSVVAFNDRGDTDSRIVKVTCTSANGPEVTITSTLERFNCRAKLVLTALLTSTSPVTSSWTVLNNMGVSVPFSALTPTVQNFSATNSITRVPYSLGIGSDVFAAGKSFTFRVTAHSLDSPKVTSFAEVVLIANSPPTAGYIFCTPSSGFALQTVFLLLSPGWTTDSASFPLSYSFTYRLSPASVYLTISTRSLRAFVTSSLPAGLSSLNSTLTLQIEAADVFFTSGTATTEVVITDASPDMPDYLKNGLQSAFFTGNVDLAFQSVNNVSHLYNILLSIPFEYPLSTSTCKFYISLSSFL